MALEQKLNLRLSQRLVMTPSLQQAIKLLQMSRLELQEVLTQEMVENPILEEQEETRRPSASRRAARQRGRAAAARGRRDRRRRGEGAGLLRGDRLQLLLRGLPRLGLQPAPVPGAARGVLARERPDAARGPARAPDLAALDVGRRRRRARDRDVPHRQHRRGRVPAGLARGDPPGALRERGRRRGGARARAPLRPGGRRRLRPAGLPAAAARGPRRRERADRDDHPRALARVPEPAVRAARQDARRRHVRDPGGLRDHQEPRAEARPQVLERAHDLRRARRLRPQDRRRVRHPALRGRPAEAAHLGARTGACCAAATARSAPRPRNYLQGQDALGGLADQEPRPAPADDLQGRRLDRAPPARRSSTTASSTCGRSCCATSPTTSGCTSRPCRASCRTSTSTRRAGSSR